MMIFHKKLQPLRSFCLLCAIVLGLFSIIATSGDEIEDETPSAPASQGTNTPPTATIDTPADTSTFNEGDWVTFAGTGTDTEDGTLTGGSLVWNSNRDGRLGIGVSIQNIALSNGTHVITLTATDSEGGAGSDTISITVNPTGNTIPTAAISAPADGSSFDQGHFITFSGTGTDAEDGSLTGNALVWKSQIDGQIGVGNTITVKDLSVGNHEIRLEVTDSRSTTGTTSISITVGNSPPVAAINSPATGATVNEGESVTFSGTGTDAEDGTLNGNALVWRSNKHGQIAIGTSPTVDFLASGTHTITLIVTDSDGATGTDAITLTVGNTAPTATITGPSDAAIYTSGQLILFSGNGTDPEDGNLSGTALVWTSNVDGYIGAGTNFSLSTLTVGTHLITLTVTDKNGLTDADSINITIQ